MTGKIIGVLISLITIIGAAFAVDGMYMRRAEAKDQQDQLVGQFQMEQRKLLVQTERDRLESDLQTTRLEISFLQELPQTSNARDREKRLRRLEYLHEREVILEDRLMKLRDKL